jgi:hypothetical protein
MSKNISFWLIFFFPLLFPTMVRNLGWRRGAGTQQDGKDGGRSGANLHIHGY